MLWKPNPRSTMPPAAHSKASTGRTETKNSLIINTTALICRFWGFVVLLVAKGSKHSLRLLFFAAFWSAKSGAKTDPPTKKAERRGLTLAPGDYSRVCKQTVPSARAFSPHLSERLFCQAGVVRRGTWREGCVRNKQEAQKPTIAPGSGFKPPHSRLQRRKNNRQPACPEREAA